MTNIQEEIWKDIPGYEGIYKISNLDRVKTLERFIDMGRCIYKRKEKLMSLCKDKNGYLLIRLCKNKVKKMQKVHRLVAINFIPNPENKPEVNHKKGIKSDNRHFELEWSTSKDNTQHAQSIGLRPVADTSKRSHHKRTIIPMIAQV